VPTEIGADAGSQGTPTRTGASFENTPDEPADVEPEAPTPPEVPQHRSGIGLGVHIIPDDTMNEEARRYARRGARHATKYAFGGRGGNRLRIPMPYSQGGVETRELGGKTMYVVKGAAREAWERGGGGATVEAGYLPKDHLRIMRDHLGHAPTGLDRRDMTEQLRQISMQHTEADQLEAAGRVREANRLRRATKHLIDNVNTTYGHVYTEL